MIPGEKYLAVFYPDGLEYTITIPEPPAVSRKKRGPGREKRPIEDYKAAHLLLLDNAIFNSIHDKTRHGFGAGLGL